MIKTAEVPDKHEIFYEKYVSKYKCPFFLLWLMREEVKILEAELKVKREGLPKTGPRPMVRNKKLLALWNTVEKLKLKDFAELYGVSYGVVRLWNRESKVERKTAEFMRKFVTGYVRELEKRVFSKKLDIEKYSLKTTKKAHALINSLLYEVKHYHPCIRYLIISSMKNRIDSLPDDQSFSFKGTFLLLITVLSDRTIFNPPRDKKSKELYEQDIKNMGELSLRIKKSIFSDFKKMIQNGETKKALRLCDWIEDQMLTMAKDNTDLTIKILNKGTQKKGKKKREKRAKPNNKKPTSA